jgi:hypothetical protein
LRSRRAAPRHDRNERLRVIVAAPSSCAAGLPSP